MSYTNLAIGCAGALLLGQLAIEATLPKSGPPRALVVEQLSYADGVVTQKVAPTAGGGMQAKWAAEANRITGGVTDQLCAGKGVGVYKGTTDSYTVNEWIGAECPDLQPGDILEADWEWTDENGLVRSVSARLVVG